MLSAAYLDMLPWAVFAVVVRRSGLGTVDAATAGAAAGLAIAVVARFRGRRAPLAWSGAACFGVVLAAASAAPTWGAPIGSVRSATVLILAVVLMASLHRVPMAAIYLADDVPPTMRRSPGFDAATRQVTRCWAICAAGVAASFAVLTAGASDLELTIWGWLVPLLLSAAGAAWCGRRCHLLVTVAAVEAATEHTAEHGVLSLPIEREAPLPRPFVRRTGRATLGLVPGGRRRWPSRQA